MKKVILLRGIPGSGKSTYCKKLWTELSVEGHLVTTFSADRYFLNDKGEYHFDGSKLGKAHGQCLKYFTLFISTRLFGDEVLIVDNTNTTTQEMLPYVQLARAFDTPFEVVTIDCDPALAAARNVHGVPTHKCFEMDKRLRSASIPKDWPQRSVSAEV